MWSDFRSRGAQAGAIATGNDAGQTLVEYVLVTGLVSVSLIATLTVLAGGVMQLFDGILAHF